MNNLKDCTIQLTDDGVFKINPGERDILDAIGITILTGEACALSMRLLCELTNDAMRLYLELTGINCDFSTIAKSNWNDRDKYSVFLTRDAMYRMVIMAYALEGWCLIEILDKKNGLSHLLAAADKNTIRKHVNHYKHVYGWFDASIGEYGEHVEGEYYNLGRWYDVYKNQPRRGLSNIHAMSGASQ